MGIQDKFLEDYGQFGHMLPRLFAIPALVHSKPLFAIYSKLYSKHRFLNVVATEVLPQTSVCWEKNRAHELRIQT